MTATLAYGDAISNHILEIDRRLKQWGIESHIYAENVESRVSQMGELDRDYEPFLDETEDWLIYHYSIYNSNVKLYHQSRNHKILIYHNITPPQFFHGYRELLESACRFGRSVLPTLRDCDWALAVSEFNRRELVDVGFPGARTAVLPILVGLDNFAESRRDSGLFKKLRGSGDVNVLYVGRIAPNKACEDLIKIIHVYRHYVNPHVHLWLVGMRSMPRYNQFLDALIGCLGMDDAVTFTGRVSLDDLRTYYEASDVFLCASRHEGFGVPLLESMHFGLPVLAYKEAAIPETLGQSGVMFTRFDYPEIAEMLDILVRDKALRQQLIETQRRRLLDFSPAHVEAQLRQLFEKLGIL